MACAIAALYVPDSSVARRTQQVGDGEVRSPIPSVEFDCRLQVGEGLLVFTHLPPGICTVAEDHGSLGVKPDGLRVVVNGVRNFSNCDCALPRLYQACGFFGSSSISFEKLSMPPFRSPPDRRIPPCAAQPLGLFGSRRMNSSISDAAR